MGWEIKSLKIGDVMQGYLPFDPLRRDMATNNRVSTPNLEIILDGSVNLDTGKTSGHSWEIKPGD
jgi:hypothetical protein